MKVYVIIIGVIVVASIILLIYYNNYTHNLPKTGQNNFQNETMVNTISDQTNVTKANRIGEIGNSFDNELRKGMGAILIDSTDKKASIRFTSQYTGTITRIVLFLNSDEPLKIMLGMQDDNGGIPSGIWLAKNTVQLNQSGSKFTAVDILGTSVEKGKVYHIVVQPESDLDTNLYMVTYYTNSFAMPYNPADPDILKPDKILDSLFYDGNNWLEQSSMPIFVVEYIDGKKDGQPYSLAAPWVIKESTHVGQKLVPYFSYNVTEVAFVVSKQGDPKDKLYYQILDSENSTLANGVFALPDELTNDMSWAKVKLQKPVRFENEKSYIIALYSPMTDIQNTYQVYGHEFSIDPTIGYGGVRHHLIISTDGGKKWMAWFDADTIFRMY